MATTPNWEHSKENAAPLRRGRNVAVLEKAARNDQNTETFISRYEKLVKASEDPDATEMKERVLVDWLSYIKYYQDNFPTDTHGQFLLLERCTRALIKVKQFSNDLRFVSVCATYAESSKNPGLVFKYLYTQKVGVQTAAFWMAWSFVAERENDFQFADQIYKKGINKNAKPPELLIQRYNQFQRRMSRHWLNASQSTHNGDDEEEEDDASEVRGALGGLRRDAVQMNSRRRVAGRHPIPRTSRRRNPMTSRSNQRNNDRDDGNSNGSFHIFVEPVGENADEQYLEQTFTGNKRVIAKDSDRRKENMLEAERWNERGGLSSKQAYGSQSRHRGRKPPAPFAVFVDEECVARHQQEEEEEKIKSQRDRRARDERTFRERGIEAPAEKLARDPLRYVRDPTKLENDIAEGDQVQQAKVEKPQPKVSSHPKASSKSRTGFKERLLRNRHGGEQTFEEARAMSKCYTLAAPSGNFNALGRDSSQMELDDGTSLDCSADETVGIPTRRLGTTRPRKLQRLNLSAERGVLGKNDSSFDSSLNRTAISTASSTVNEVDAVGIPGRREEETINTKLAMKELSMMFSSPAFGIDEIARKSERRDKSYFDKSFRDDQEPYMPVGDLIENAALDNSILNPSNVAEENHEELKLFAASPQPPAIEKAVLRSTNRGSRSQIPATSKSDMQEGKGVGSSGPICFSIFEDGAETDNGAVQAGKKRPAEEGPSKFLIFEDAPHHEGDEEREPENATGRGERKPLMTSFTIFEDSTMNDGIGRSEEKEYEAERTQGEQRKQPSKASFSIFEDDRTTPRKANRDSSPHMQSVDNEEKKTLKGPFQIFEDDRTTPQKANNDSSPHMHNTDNRHDDGETGDTADPALFRDAMDMLNEKQDDDVADNVKPSRPAPVPVRRSQRRRTLSQNNKSTFPIFCDDEERERDDKKDLARHSASTHENTDHDNVATDHEDVAADHEDAAAEPPLVRPYGETYEGEVKLALSRILATSTIPTNPTMPLLKLFSAKKVFYLPQVLMPRLFRRREIPKGSSFKIGNHDGTCKEELGRGAYGVVVILESKTKKGNSLVAMKAQTPTNCLAWECEILQRIEKRVDTKKRKEYPFPRALSLVAMADGAALGMTAASESGLNLVDLTNVYKAKCNKPVPEILALHYTSRMLRHVELLHWHGKVLHCDIKPDNFVLTQNPSKGDGCPGIEYSDLTLVDFGRAIDLTTCTDHEARTLNVRLMGNASRRDMLCVAMRGERPWSFDIDTYGVLCSAHMLLFGTHMEIREGKDGTWRPTLAFKRYWERDLWEEIFDTLLSLDSISGTAIGSRPHSLRSLQKKIRNYLNDKQNDLLSALEKQAELLPSTRDKIGKI